MDFRKFQDSVPKGMEQWFNNLMLKLANPPSLRRGKCFCMWSDLLGFGDIFTKNNWNLSTQDILKVYERLASAHTTALYYSSGQERTFILNDGIARVYHPRSKDSINNVLSVSMFIRACVEIHMSVSKTEHANGYPGCRSVLSFGDNFNYITGEVRYDDYVLNYTKPEGQEISDVAKSIDNPIVVYNPVEFQMNTAFSKAYILESMGSSAGIAGNYFFFDQDSVDALVNYSKDKGYQQVWFEEDGELKLFIPFSPDNLKEVVMGFAFDKEIIDVATPKINTRVYRLLKYYPWDESTDDFFFDLTDPDSTFL